MVGAPRFMSRVAGFVNFKFGTGFAGGGHVIDLLQKFVILASGMRTFPIFILVIRAV